MKIVFIAPGYYDKMGTCYGTIAEKAFIPLLVRHVMMVFIHVWVVLICIIWVYEFVVWTPF
ncbi:MAG TPA: hypothetical protein ACFYEF_00385 [Candidatus Wunengus sp. YC63]|uniref:hypothetical protein n=1 Tax=Candidatus Wunengus sp. YC63 TaxID=3367699 RepID=UPI004029F54B